MSVLEIVILLPVLAALAVLFGAPARAASVGAALVNLIIVLALSWQYAAKGSTGLAFTHAREILANPAMSFSVGADGVSLILALLTTIVMFAAVWQIQDRPTIFYVATLLIGGGALGAFLTTDVFFIYAFHELALIPTFLMIALHGHAEPIERKKVAWKATIYLGIGSLVLLAGLVWLVVEFSGGRGLTFDLEALRAQAKLTPLPIEKQGVIFFLLLLGFGTLVSLFPFHSWAAPAYATAPTPVAMLHSGVLKKFGLYGLLRIALPLLPHGANVPWVQNALLLMLLGNILVMGLVTIRASRLDDTLANSSVMHMGYIFLALAAGSELALKGAVLLMFAHGVSIALLFALTGKMRNQLGTLEYSKLGGLASHAPTFTVLFAFGAFASIGLPGLSNFAGEVMVFAGSFIGFKGVFTNLHWAVILALWGVVMSAVYMLRAYRSIFHGSATTGLFMSDPALPQRLPLILMAAILLLTGCCPWLLLNLLKGALAAG
ncbi:MAG: NuoM family protein [Prosthecobacter sp.]